MENYTKALELNANDLKNPEKNRIMMVKLLKFENLRLHVLNCNGNSNCDVCLKFSLFSKIFSFFEKENLGKLEMEKMTEEDIYNFFFVNDLVEIKKSGENFNIFIH